MKEGIVLFQKLEKQIIMTIAITICFCSILASIVTYMNIRKNIFNNFIPLAIQAAIQQQKNADLFLDLTAETSKLLLNDPEFEKNLQKISTNSYETSQLIDKLSDIQASNLNIVGITLYSMNGNSYSSSPTQTANATPSLQQILRDPIMQKFIQGPEKYIWAERYQQDYWHTNLVLNNNLVKGVFSITMKYYDQNNLLIGLLVTDISLNSLYSYFDNRNFHTDTYLFSKRRGLLKTPFSKPLTHSIIKKIKRNIMERNNQPQIYNHQIIVFHQLPYSNNSLIQIISLKTISNKIKQFLSFLVISCIILTIPAILLGLVISKSISLPLTGLYTKMQQFFHRE
jgi:hypothetical protein